MRCPNSPWVQRANTFLNTHQNAPDVRWHTVNFLIQNNHCGITDRVKMDDVLNHLVTQGLPQNREEFQQGALGELKRMGIVATLPYPGPQGGVFIPCSEDEMRTATTQILGRIVSEIGNLVGMAQGTSFHNNLLGLQTQINNWRQTNNL
jgi:hypothetical protein